MTLAERRAQLLAWLQADPTHQGLDDDQIHARSHLYDSSRTTTGMCSWRTTHDLHTLQYEGLVTTDKPWNGRWWPIPTTERSNG